MSNKFSKQSVGVRYAVTASSHFDRDYYYLTEPLNYLIENVPSEKSVSIPAGYLSDGATIPRIFWSLVSPMGKHSQACFVHDYLCEYLTIVADGSPQFITREEADKIFHQCLLDSGVSKGLARVMYMGVSVYRNLTRVNLPSYSKIKYDMENALRKTLAEEKELEDLRNCKA